MKFLLLQAGLDTSTYAQFGIAGALVMLIFVFLGCLLKALPSWKEVRLAEIKVRETEAEARTAQATSFGQLSGALSSISEVLNNVAIKQKEATDKVLILQRVNAESDQRTDEKFDLVIEHIDGLTQRVEAVEQAMTGKAKGR
jgi:hypothetical protein